jgi:hypothetical protein
MVEVDASSMFHGNGRHRVSGSTRRLLRFSNAAGTKGNAYVDVTDSNASYASTGPVDVSNATTYRPGGGSWVLADFADDKTLFVCCQITSGNAVFTSIWGDIAYTPPAGVLVFLLQLAGHGALPFVGAMDFGQFLRYLSWRRASHPRHTILTDDEVRQAWRELREYRHPRFFLPAL